MDAAHTQRLLEEIRTDEEERSARLQAELIPRNIIDEVAPKLSDAERSLAASVEEPQPAQLKLFNVRPTQT
jgi:hypothetical protein